MKNRNRIMAVLMAAALATTSFTAFAADTPISEKAEVSGSGVIEYDNSVAPSYVDVVLPTIADDTYDFTIDPSQQLNKYDSSNYGDYTVYFKSTASVTSAAIDTGVITSSDNKIYKLEKQAIVDSGSDIVDAVNNAFTVLSSAITGPKSGDDKKLYVWVPKLDGNNFTDKGQYVELTDSNIDQYLDLVYASDGNSVDTVTFKSPTVNKEETLSNSSVCDGKLYKVDYVENTDMTGITVKLDSGTYKADTVNGCYYKDTSSTMQPLNATGIIINPVVYQNTNKTDKAVIRNKSTKDVTVTAEYNVTSAGAIVLAKDNAEALFTAPATSGAAMAVKVSSTKDSATTANYVTSGGLTLSFDLDGADLVSTTIQDTTTQNPATGGNNYFQFLNAGYDDDANYKSVEFEVEASAHKYEQDKLNDDANAKVQAAWEAYYETVTGADFRPGLDVVYSIEEKGQEPEVVDAAPSIAVTTYNIKNVTGALDIDVTPGTGTYSDVTVEKIEYEWLDGVRYDDSGATYNASTNKITVPESFVNIAKQNLPSDKSFTLIITFDDTTEIEVTITNQ